ncbi:putative monovalent cation/H+ antiporter subunit A [soil metagenome]
MLLTLILIIGVPFLLAVPAYLLPGRWGGWISLLAPAVVLALGVPLWPRVAEGEAVILAVPWFESIGIGSIAINANLRVDRLGVFFVLLIGGIGLGIVQYSRGYFKKEGSSPLFWGSLLAFMGAMLGLALSDSLILLFLFWELTTITSALLIGVHYKEAKARRGAIQAFLVTGAGSLAMLAGIVLLGLRAGTFSLFELTEQAETIIADPWHRLALVLMLLGAFTKSAQFPFHFWLPGAMEAPAPVSAFLHSAAMVKAGILLIGRMVPIFEGSDLWQPILVTVGLTTYIVSGYLALKARDLKLLLAYSTSAFLGVIVAFYGYADGPRPRGELLHIANHALYKSSLFLLVGWLEKVSGTRDLTLLEEHRWCIRFPLAGLLFAIGAPAMAGFPLLLGFVSKEAFYKAVMGGSFSGWSPALIATMIGSTLAVAYALKVFVSTFWGPADPPEASKLKPEYRPSVWLLIVPAIFLVPQLVGGIIPAHLMGLLEPEQRWEEGMAFFHHVDAKLWISLLTYALGLGLYLSWRRVEALPMIPGPQRAADLLSDGTLSGATWLSKAMQHGGHPRHLSIILLATVVALVGGMVGAGVRFSDLVGPWGPDPGKGLIPTLLIAAGAILSLVLRGRLPKILAMSLVGFAVVGVFVLFRAPDLALTQILTESIMLILLLLIVQHFPKLLADRRPLRQKVSHGVVAVIVGVSMAALTWSAGAFSARDPAGAEQLRMSLPEAHGRNVVNVIMVDFRGVDTIGEILVLAVASLGIVTLFRAGRERLLKRDPEAGLDHSPTALRDPDESNPTEEAIETPGGEGS